MLPIMTSPDVAQADADTAVLPVGSFEQHGRYLPLTTDSLVATAIAERIAEDYRLLRLPAVTFGCSHEHVGFAGTVSISPTTLYAVVNDVAASLANAGIHRLVIINGHGGNYLLANVVQEANATARRMVLFPQPDDWNDARLDAQLVTSNHADMHGGEAETSILLHRYPEVVRAGYEAADHTVDDRRHLLTEGIKPYAPDGTIGLPSLASADKGRRLLGAFSDLFKDHLAVLRGSP
jgi:creatinine amidohydrolase